MTETNTQTTTLAQPHVHELWESGFRDPQNELFYERVFDDIAATTGAAPGETFLDIGCGPGFHALRLARRGYRVKAIDFSEAVLAMGRETVRAAEMSDRIEFAQEDLINLSFEDGAFPAILCWGVLMHVPQVDRAIHEVARVLAPGGDLFVSEGNMRAPETIAMLAAKRLAGTTVVRRTPAGIDQWKETAAGSLLTRRANIAWLVDRFEQEGLQLEQRRPSQFTELYAKPLPRSLKRCAYAANNLYRRVGPSQLAAGNLLRFSRP